MADDTCTGQPDCRAKSHNADCLSQGAVSH